MLKAQIFINKDKLRGTQPLHEIIMKFLIENDIAGATSFVGISGFGHHKILKQPERRFSFDETPMVISFVDKEDKVKAVIQKLRKEYKGGLIITFPVTEW